MLDKPYDFAVIFGIFALVVVTIGFGIESVMTNTNASVGDTSFFTNVKLRVNGTDGLVATSQTMSNSIRGETSAGTTPSEEGLLVKGFNSLLSLGATFEIFSDSMADASAAIGIHPIYWTVILGVLLVIFAVTLYTWLRAR